MLINQVLILNNSKYRKNNTVVKYAIILKGSGASTVFIDSTGGKERMNETNHFTSFYLIFFCN